MRFIFCNALLNFEVDHEACYSYRAESSRTMKKGKKGGVSRADGYAVKPEAVNNNQGRQMDRERQQPTVHCNLESDDLGRFSQVSLIHCCGNSKTSQLK